jgi:hypothetical protein
MMMLTWLALVLLVGFLCWVARPSSIRASNDERQQQEAEAKGLALLLENLDPRQREQYDRFGYFDAVGSETGRRYRICHGVSRNVSELFDDNRLGAGRCFMPRGNLAAGDCMLAQKIMLENCEEEALRVALRF